jgi:hypothetical protein
MDRVRYTIVIVLITALVVALVTVFATRQEEELSFSPEGLPGYFYDPLIDCLWRCNIQDADDRRECEEQLDRDRFTCQIDFALCTAFTNNPEECKPELDDCNTRAVDKRDQCLIDSEGRRAECFVSCWCRIIPELCL